MRAEGLGAVALLLILFDRLSDRIFGYSVSTLLLYAFSRCFPSASAKVSSTAGNSAIGVIVVKAWRSLDGAVVAAIRLFNPFTGAADALRLPPAKVRLNCSGNGSSISLILRDATVGSNSTSGVPGLCGFPFRCPGHVGVARVRS